MLLATAPSVPSPHSHPRQIYKAGTQVRAHAHLAPRTSPGDVVAQLESFAIDDRHTSERLGTNARVTGSKNYLL